MRICYSFASRSRPQKFFTCIDAVKDLSESKDYFIWAKLDEDDLFADVYLKRIDEYPELVVNWGKSDNKIHAINRSMENLPPCDIIVVLSDDMIFEVYGFDNEIRDAFKNCFPNFDGVVHFPDSHALERTMTLTIMGANLYKQLGYLYHPLFESVYADNHLTELTKAMGRYVFINKQIFDHHHPGWQMAEWDEQYKKTESPEYYQKDHKTYIKLKENNFGL